MEKEDEEKKKEAGNIVWDCGSPLYDSYEIVSLGHVIERHMMALPFPCGSKRFISGPNFSREEKGLIKVKNNKERFKEEGFLSRMVGYLRKMIRVKERNKKNRKMMMLRSRFYSVGSSLFLFRKKAASSRK